MQSFLESGDGGVIIDVECTMTRGLPNIIIVGFANKAVDEAKERMRGAFASSELVMPRRRITINLAPADLPKDGTGYDLAMAASILTAGRARFPAQLQQVLIFGELGLDGSVRPIRGIIGKLNLAKRLGFTRFIIPAGNRDQAALIPGITLMPVARLPDLYEAITELEPLPELVSGRLKPPQFQQPDSLQFEDVVGQVMAKRALQIAAAGGHNILLSGPPGTGKSMLAKALPSILPALTIDEMLEVTHLHSLASKQYERLITERPFRAPHHTASHLSVIGGGGKPKPGEVSLAHHGVLFMDELPEFGRTTMEALRQPLEDQRITITRAQDSITFPAQFILVATANPCPCGFYGSGKRCTCLQSQIRHYQLKLSGPIMDRIDLYVEVEAVEHEKLLQSPVSNGAEQTSAFIRKQIESARNRQQQRFGTTLKTNAGMSNKELKQLANCSAAAHRLLNVAAKRLGLSARAYMRSLKVARTIADLEASHNIKKDHISEALQYRTHGPPP